MWDAIEVQPVTGNSPTCSARKCTEKLRYIAWFKRNGEPVHGVFYWCPRCDTPTQRSTQRT